MAKAKTKKTAHQHCGCTGDCDKSQPCPQQFNCGCGAAPRDAQAKLTTNTTPLRDGTPCVRTAIQLGEACSSIDVLARDGSLLCRLNLFDFVDGGGNVDVILDEKQRGTLLAWHKGAENIRHTTPAGTTVHAIAIGPHAFVPACARDMGCLCAGHARGNPAFAACDTAER